MYRIAQIQWEIVYIRCTDCLDCRKIKYLNLHKFNGKLCTLDVRIIWICRKSKLCGYVERT